MLGVYEPDEYKGGKPNPGTPKDGRLKENNPDDGDGGSGGGGKKPKKPAFPGAAPPFGKGDTGKGKGK